ncbi:MAG: hypothetical protein HFF17_11235 [Oscillospiraceae bacterium]|nr:hypothetical protein [Oscillospiraceae bacterium]
MTLGAGGCLHAENGGVVHAEAAAPLGAAPETAMANLTIGKLGVTGTASPEEICAAARRQLLQGGNRE